MKAMVHERYGPPEVLALKEIEQPVPKRHEVLIRVHAVAINDWDWAILEGKQLINRLLYGVWKPRLTILGCDVAGRCIGCAGVD